MICVIDNALSEEARLVARDYFHNIGTSSIIAWADGTLNEFIAYGSPLAHILQITNKYVDLTNMVGCEYWSNLNEKSGWHKDTDETVLYRDGVEKFPICSCVYYPEVDVTLGGDLLLETVRVKAVTNRLVIFSPGMLHVIEDFLGYRLSIAVNPWLYKLESACQSK